MGFFFFCNWSLKLRCIQPLFLIKVHTIATCNVFCSFQYHSRISIGWFLVLISQLSSRMFFSFLVLTSQLQSQVFFLRFNITIEFPNVFTRFSVTQFRSNQLLLIPISHSNSQKLSVCFDNPFPGYFVSTLHSNYQTVLTITTQTSLFQHYIQIRKKFWQLQSRWFCFDITIKFATSTVTTKSQFVLDLSWDSRQRSTREPFSTKRKPNLS